MNLKNYQKEILNGISFLDYSNAIKIKIDETDLSILNNEQKIEFEKIKLNFIRMNRIEKTYSLSYKMIEAIKNISKQQIWLILTEDWCGDSAQNVPYINKIAMLNSLIKIKILARDEHLELMNLFLTNGTQSIPKLIVINENWEVEFTWGPRPIKGQEIVTKLKSEGFNKDYFLEKLHLWYGRDKGIALENELMEIIRKQFYFSLFSLTKNKIINPAMKKNAIDKIANL